MKPFVVLFLLLLSISLSYAQVSLDQVKDIADELDIPGVQIVYAKPGETHSYYVGKIREGQAVQVTPETRFQAASLTKVVVAYVFFKLYDQGLIDLDTPLSEYYSYDRIQDNQAAKTITARMVLTHQTGFQNWEGDVPTDEWRASPLHSLFKPGTQYKYSGEGFYYLQLVMAAVAKTPFRELIRDWALKPLGMDHSDIIWNESMEGNTASGHQENKKPLALKKMERPNAAYTLYTTAEDYARFIERALNTGEGLKSETHQLMISRAGEVQRGDSPEEIDAKVPTALGVRMQINEKGTWLWHTGSNPGFRDYFLTHPETGESIVVFTNSANGFKTMPLYFQLFLGSDQTYWAYKWRHGELD